MRWKIWSEERHSCVSLSIRGLIILLIGMPLSPRFVKKISKHVDARNNRVVLRYINVRNPFDCSKSVEGFPGKKLQHGTVVFRSAHEYWWSSRVQYFLSPPFNKKKFKKAKARKSYGALHTCVPACVDPSKIFLEKNVCDGLQCYSTVVFHHAYECLRFS